ncbi:type IV toxin-antitoxin system AbiEi family antitoxin domain-containing protein [uncultured Jatrophihabitans sp.]|uniref:type IV toxin-antitoxin system AbiEi family antitoxin domain-containing protein n=1 Tax=uncultured Jatrophihabitans sp. TaxID=1610747 RepID=UPI0035CBE82F
MFELPDPGWYLDNVLVHAQPGSDARIVVHETDSWQRWWRTQLDRAAHEYPVPAALAAEQGTVVTSRQLAEAGVARHVVRRLVRDGLWSAPQPGIVSLIDPSDDDRWVLARRRCAIRCAGAALANPGHAVSRPGAAVLHGLPTRQVPGTASLTAARRGNARHGSRVAALEPADVTEWFGTAVTTPARTCVDLARHDRRAGLMAADAALRQKLTTRAELESALDWARGWYGVRQAREVIRFADPRAESPLESVVRLALHDSGFPPPELQYEIFLPGRRWPLRVDFCWPEHRLVLEADGRTKYVGDANWREKQREALIRPLGFRIERVIQADVEDTWATTSAYLWAALGRC